MNSSNRYLFSNTNKDPGLPSQRSPQPSTLQNKNSEPIDMSLNALLNMSCNKIDTVTVNSNRTPISPQLPSRVPQTVNQRKPGSNVTVLDEDEGQNTKKDGTTGNFVVLQGQNMLFEDIDFWLIFDNQVNTSVGTLMEQLRNQFESINIVKVKQAFYLDRQREDASKVTGWKLFDKSSANEIIMRTKELMFYVNSRYAIQTKLIILDRKLKYEVISSTQELRMYLRKNELDQRLSQADLFKDEYATPLLKLQIQGLFYYEFDYIDISPETVCVLCGLPTNINNAKLKEYLKESELPEPLNILRNPFEGETCVRLTFENQSDADMFRFKGFKVPLIGPFPEKPLIIMPIKDRGFDYFTQLLKYQVMVDFEANEDHTLQSKIEMLKKIQSNYGLVSDVNILYSELWIITFIHSDSATRCMDQTQFDQFNLKLSFSKPPTPHMLTGYLFQAEATMTRTTNAPTRPPPLLRVDPNQLKIKSEQFEKNQNLKRRYQKVYLRQKESLANESNQGLVEFYNNDIKEKLEPLPLMIELKPLEQQSSFKPQVMQIEEEKAPEKFMEGDRKVIVEDEDEEIPITIHGEVTREPPAPKNTSPKKNKRKPAAPKKRAKVNEDTKNREEEDEDYSLNRKRQLSPRDTSLETRTKPNNKIVHKNDDENLRMLSPPRYTSLEDPKARKTVFKSPKDILNKKRQEEAQAESPKKREITKGKDKSTGRETNLEGEQFFIQKNIEKIKNLIESHRDMRKKKNMEDIEVKEEEEGQEEEQEIQVEKPKSWKNEKIIAKAKKSSRTKK